MDLINMIDSFEHELYKYKYFDSLSRKEQEYLNYLISSIEKHIIRTLKTKNKEQILHLGNIVFDIWMKYDIPLYETYFDDLNQI